MTAKLRLEEQQRWFLLASTGAADVHASAELASRALGRLLPVEHCVTDGPRLTAVERLAIYHEGYLARLVECLADDYPALRFLVGEDAFDLLARAYVKEYPSGSPSLNAYGSKMATFLRTRSESWAPFAAELARFEWALVEVVHAPSRARLAAEALATIPADRWPTARLIPSATLRLLAFEYPVNDYYQAFREDLSPERPARQPSWTAVCRQGLPVSRVGLERSAALLLEDLLAGCPLASAVTEAARRSDDPAAVVSNLPVWLGSWVASGFFCAVEW